MFFSQNTCIILYKTKFKNVKRVIMYTYLKRIPYILYHPIHNAFISNIKELKGFLKRGPAKNKSRIETVIQLYEGKKIPNFKTALNLV